MKKVFVRTANVEAFQAAIAAVKNRGAPESSWVLADGLPALGKSRIVDRWAVQEGAVYLRAKEQWTPSFFLAELAESLKVDLTGRTKDRFQRVAARIGHQQIPIVIDEVQHALRDSAAVLEVLRDITDLTESVAVLVAGDGLVQTKLTRHTQIASRIYRVVEFVPCTPEDTLLACAELADVSIAHDLVAAIHQQSGGRMRLIVNAISTVEAHARRNKLAAVALADMAGQEIINDWQARRPRGGKRP